MDDTIILFVVAAASLIGCVGWLLTLVLTFLTFRVWIRGRLGGVRVSILEIVGTRLRGAPPGLLVDAMLDLKRRGVEASAAEVESAYLRRKEERFTAAELADLVLQRRA